MRQYTCLAFDLGATSSRAYIGSMKDGEFNFFEIGRFKGYAEETPNYYWNLPLLLEEIQHLLVSAIEKYNISSVSFDTWGVDYVSLYQDGTFEKKPCSYRHPRTARFPEALDKIISRYDLYLETGVYPQAINTVYQLLSQPGIAARSGVKSILLLPDFLNYFFTGVKGAEHTIASTTGLFNPVALKWNQKLLDLLGINASLLAKPLAPGNKLGHVLGEKLGEVAEKCDNFSHNPVVYSVCSHDTASAVLALPVQDEEPALFLSCGTWSILGIERNDPLATVQSFEHGFSNELGAAGKVLLLRNITGLLLFERCRQELEAKGVYLSFKEIEEACLKEGEERLWLDVNHPLFLTKTSFFDAVRQYADETGQPFQEQPGFLYRSIYESLAMSYRIACRDLGELTELPDKLYLIGGGSKSSYLGQLIADATNREVIVGPAEGSALGNILMQMIASGCLADIRAARRLVSENFPAVHYAPSSEFDWSSAEVDFLKLTD